VAVEILYETHAVSTDNEAGIASGWLPGELSPTGRQLATRLGERYRTRTIAAVFASDLARAVQTARIAFADRGIPIHHDARLRECNYGAYNGMPVSQLTGERSRHIDRPWPAGQSYRQVVTQVGGFLRDLAADWDGRTVVVIGHSATKWALDCLLDGKTLDDLVDAPFQWQEGWRYLLERRVGAPPYPE
jgi:broad specificity phosphatase PhoE